jgi:hypothetical protein
MTTRVNAKQLETPVGNAKLVALGRVSGAVHLPDEESPVQHPAAFGEAQQDHGIDQGRDSNSRERVFRRGGSAIAWGSALAVFPGPASVIQLLMQQLVKAGPGPAR